MEQYIKKSDIVAELVRKMNRCKKILLDLRTLQNKDYYQGKSEAYKDILSLLNIIEVKEIDLYLENENNNPKITVGTKIRSKTNPDIILSIISNDCHEDEFECSNGSVLSLKQIEKYYDIII